MDSSLLFFFLVLKSDKHLCLALMAWVLLSACACECKSVGVAQEAHDHSYFRTQSVVNKVHPYYHSGIKHEQNNSISIQVKMTGNVGLA